MVVVSRDQYFQKVKIIKNIYNNLAFRNGTRQIFQLHHLKIEIQKHVFVGLTRVCKEVRQITHNKWKYYMLKTQY